ncbi:MULTISPECIES: DNA-entry nuclease [Lacticaseibacillus]|uniref:DNA-entry nuclease n=2 Tax=Lacticaseibacillus TaxID=2759736 RepID=A0AAN1C7X0_LACCA|nr:MULTISPECIES: DNA-entry nuclease [Lacticaseibacillus]ARY91254.1 DNA-entry nuclease [Lacticaseibacillus casei]KAB1968430.1 DNA-entry nuclease [Lacticaseibacillus casei]WLV81872.1 DNA-entry nuclease [Lacticaseibacillus sp. NCIMB 15473]WNX25778.1 DNA-entry nuclease [Lacticaseibacillus casei]WNX28551.1 DNA-entry nuclease [Lacticaseibacillus casei]
MSTLGNLFVMLGLIGTVWGTIRLVRQRKHPLTKRFNLIILIGGIVLMFVGSPMVDTKPSTASSAQTTTKKLTAKQKSLLKSEKARGKVLLAAKAKKSSELKALKKEQTKLEDQLDARASSSRAVEESASSAASESASREASASKVAASSAQAASSSQAAAAAAAAKQQAEEAKKSAAQQQQQQQQQQQAAATQQQAPTNQGDMNTAEQGTIVGNSRSMIYHVPGQAGYHMNSANAVYFKTEADAQAHGYRKALR